MENWAEDIVIKTDPGNMMNGNNHFAHGHQPQGNYQNRGPQSSKTFAIRIRGIPFTESEFTVLRWFSEKGIHIRNGVLGVHFLYKDKRQWTGDAYLSLEGEKDFQLAMGLNNAQMQHRYLEVFESTQEEMESALKRSGIHRLPNDYAVRLRGLEYKVSKEDIRDFFQGSDIASGLDGIIIVKSQEGRPTGEAYVLFENKGAVEKAVQKHKEKMGQRYIEIFLASSAQVRDAQEDFGGGMMDHERGGGRGFDNNNFRDGRQMSPPMGYYDRFPPPDNWHDDRHSPSAERFHGGPFRGQQNFQPYGHNHGGPVLRLYMRGLPWTCSEQDIEKFFAPTRVRCITKNMSATNVFDGSAWVEFDNDADMMAAKKLHKTNLMHRYVELFTDDEVDQKRLLKGGRDGGGPRDGGRGGGRGRGDRRGDGDRRGGGGGGGRGGGDRGRSPRSKGNSGSSQRDFQSRRGRGGSNQRSSSPPQRTSRGQYDNNNSQQSPGPAYGGYSSSSQGGMMSSQGMIQPQSMLQQQPGPNMMNPGVLQTGIGGLQGYGLGRPTGSDNMPFSGGDGQMQMQSFGTFQQDYNRNQQQMMQPQMQQFSTPFGSYPQQTQQGFGISQQLPQQQMPQQQYMQDNSGVGQGYPRW